MEVQFVQGVKMGERAALQVRGVAARNNVILSAHAPYYVNLNARELEKVSASEARLVQTARITHALGGHSFVFHAAFYMGDPPEVVYGRVKAILDKVARQIRQEGINVLMRPEVTGKPTQFGTVAEVLRLSAEIEGVAPAIDFSHWHARTGNFNSYDEFLAVLQQIESVLGKKGLQTMHVHLSGIVYTKSGERAHLPLKESNLRYEDLLRALKIKGAGGTLVCESPNLEEDALLLQQTYNSL
jgi:deoxyribonuclease-4